jgi:hypothetical protein
VSVVPRITCADRLRRHTFGNEQGGLFLLTGLIIVLVVSLLGAALFDLSRVESLVLRGDALGTQALYCAEAGLARTLNDVTRTTAIGNVAAGASTTFGPDTAATQSGTCSNAITFTNPASGAPYLTSTATLPGGVQRGLRVTINFLTTGFEYALVANGGDLHLRGSGAPNTSGAGGADVINGDIIVNGNVILGESGAPSPQSPAVNPKSTTDTRATISIKSGSGYSVMDHSNAFPQTSPSDPNPTGTSSTMPQPDVAQYVTDVKSAVGLTSANVGAMTGTYKGSPVYNLKAIFDPTVGLGTNADGSLPQPSGCGCGAPATSKCKVYCDLRTMNVKKNPSDRSAENATTTGDDYYIDGVKQSGEIFASPKVDQQGATRLVDMAIPNSEPPILLADGTLRFHANDAYGFAIDGRATMVATQDFILSDNVIYKDGIATTNLDPTKGATADVLGIVAQRDIWFGDPRFGTFFEGSGVMLAGRDFNFMFFKEDGSCCRTPDNAITLNGTLLANREAALFRDFANPNDRMDQCGPGSQYCQPVAYFPGTGWRFMLRDSSGNLVVDSSRAAFSECLSTAWSCSSSNFKIAHYQMTLNYETRLGTTPALIPPGLPTGTAGKIIAGWQDWRECPPCN